MASERQKAANRRNAAKSTGPRSLAGKRRSSKNAYRHGLATFPSGAEFEQQLEMLARQIAGETTDSIKREDARVAAEAALQILRVQRVRNAMFEKIQLAGIHLRGEGGGIDPPLAYLAHTKSPQPTIRDPIAATLGEETLPFAESTLDILSDLAKLARYEQRAAGRSDRAIRNMVRRYGLR